MANVSSARSAQELDAAEDGRSSTTCMPSIRISPSSKPGKRKQPVDQESRKQKRTKTSRFKTRSKDDGPLPDREEGVDEAIAKMDGQLLSDYLVQKAKRFEKYLTSVELEDRCISGA